ncbi:MAG: arginine N-succinyltransferase [Gammaproteobacteria bacterium]|nr:arginine N-succinyltransferase [Gammaproteobacteria bacterium]NNJ50208.1 arginine N-succinyltransferase [Gammaproteobacteria bacterium]
MSRKSDPRPAQNGWRTFGIVIITVLITAGAGYWLVTSYLFPTKFNPVVLNAADQHHLDEKLERLGIGTNATSSSNASTKAASKKALQPEAYTEAGASRDIDFSEKEFNALLAKNTDLASKLAFDFSDNLASAKLLVDLDPDFPVLGGKTLKVTAGMEIKLSNGKPSAILKGVSVWGVPIPNAWLGNLKNTDLNETFGEAGGFWQAINEGVEEIEVKEGKLHIRLKE